MQFICGKFLLLTLYCKPSLSIGKLHNFVLFSTSASNYSNIKLNACPYKTLGIARNATHDEIREAYIRKSKEFHPDSNPNKPYSHQSFIDIQHAYKALSRASSSKHNDDSGTWKWGDDNAASYRQRQTADFSKAYIPTAWMVLFSDLYQNMSKPKALSFILCYCAFLAWLFHPKPADADDVVVVLLKGRKRHIDQMQLLDEEKEAVTRLGQLYLIRDSVMSGDKEELLVLDKQIQVLEIRLDICDDR